MKVLSSWSGGKDSCFALMKAIEQGYSPTAILNMMNENGKVSRSHGIPFSILQQQAKMLQLPLITNAATWTDYESNFVATLKEIQNTYKTEYVVFGDIDLQPHRDWEEKVCELTQHKAVLPLWQQNRLDLVYEMLDAGIETMIVSCNLHLGESFLGKIITKDVVNELIEKGVDACGENGEYHTLVINCPIFKNKIELPKFTKKTYDNYCFLIWEE